MGVLITVGNKSPSLNGKNNLKIWKLQIFSVSLQKQSVSWRNESRLSLRRTGITFAIVQLIRRIEYELYVANPLYDAVFKYMMEDERIAKTLLSALLQKTVIAVEMRRHEYPNISRDAISMFCVDFAATVLENDGSKKLILIELQKTWLETETLRFRQYLAVQYNNKENMRKETKGKYALPTMAVYLLGHCVGKFTEPVIYAKHKVYDYEGNEILQETPDPFVESLQHDSIIVQIPLLRGRVNNRLEKILSVFDQSQIYPDDQRMLELDENKYADDAEMEHILHRLQSAAANPDIRNRMNAEEVYIKPLQDRDTTIMQMNKMIEEQDAMLKAIEEKKKTLQEKDAALEEQKASLRAAVLALSKTGMTAEMIAKTLNIGEEKIQKILS